MSEWRAALIPEGRADDGLVTLLERLCLREGASVEIVSMRPLLELHTPGRSNEAKLYAVLEFGEDYDIIFIHSDTDREPPPTRGDRISTACEKLGVESYVPVVPIRETEAWLLVDKDAIRAIVGNPKGNKALPLPKLSHVESAGDPKQCLRDALDAARIGQRRKQKHRPVSDQEFGRYRQRLLEELDIEGPIRQLSAWQALERDLKSVLSQLDAAPPSL